MDARTAPSGRQMSVVGRDAAMDGGVPGTLSLLAQAVGTLETAVATLRDQLRETELRAEIAEAGASQARTEVVKARQRVEVLEAEQQVRQARGRLRRAWDGWRGR